MGRSVYSPGHGPGKTLRWRPPSSCEDSSSSSRRRVTGPSVRNWFRVDGACQLLSDPRHRRRHGAQAPPNLK
eukprot:2862155-Rhodomonas_salina.1